MRKYKINLLNGQLTPFYIQTDISSFHKQLIDIYTKQDKYLPNVFNKKIRNLCDKNHSFNNVSRINSLCCIPNMVPTFWLLQPMINLYKFDIPQQSITTLLHFFFIISRSYNDDFMDEIITLMMMMIMMMIINKIIIMTSHRIIIGVILLYGIHTEPSVLYIYVILMFIVMI